MNNVLIKLWLLVLIIHTTVCKENQVKSQKKVCVIGAGPCGLPAIKAASYQFQVVAFERNSDVGGLWIYTDKIGFDEYGLPIHSSMYKNLRTNTPKELMTYPDFRDFRGEEHSCVKYNTVLEYLRNYTDHFNLRQFIQFNTYVEKVSPISKETNTKWLVETRNLTSNDHKQTVCDAIMICNGNLFEPNVPRIPGIEKFPGRVLHSHSYRKPEEFTGQTVVILGASFSGIDIGIEISKYAKKIYLSHRHKKIASELPSNMEQVPGVVKAGGDQLILSNDTSIVADSFILCTGFKYSFPFLDSHSGIVVDNGKFVHPLYKGLINVNYTTMSFLGLARDNVGFLTYDLQARYFLSVFRGDTKLPNYQDMLDDSKLPANVGINHLHAFGDNQWSYYTDLAKAAHFADLPPFYEKGSKIWSIFTDVNFMNFKDRDLRVVNDEDVEIVKWTIRKDA